AWGALLDVLSAKKVVVHSVAVGGTSGGQPIPVSINGARTDLTYQGERVLTQRSDQALDAVRRATGGAFLPMGLRAANLGALYRDGIAPLERRKRALAHPPELVDRYALFVALALGLLTLSAWPRARRASLGALAVLAFGLGAGPLG